MKDETISIFIENEITKVKRHTKVCNLKRVKLMCPHCFRLYERNVAEVLETKITSIDKNQSNDEPTITLDPYTTYTILDCKCGKSGNVIELDWNIADIVAELNKKGFKTDACCEGHDSERRIVYNENLSINPYILFSDDKIIRFYNSLPISWEIDVDFLKNDCLALFNKHRISIYTELYNKEEALEELKEFVQSLPNIQKM